MSSVEMKWAIVQALITLPDEAIPGILELVEKKLVEDKQKSDENPEAG